MDKVWNITQLAELQDKILHGHRVFGGIETVSKKYFLVEEPDPTEKTLSAVTESRIVSNGWRSYNNIGSLNGHMHTYKVIVHQENFDPANVYIQTVENKWISVKRKE